MMDQGRATALGLVADPAGAYGVGILTLDVVRAYMLTTVHQPSFDLISFSDQTAPCSRRGADVLAGLFQKAESISLFT